MPRLPEHGFPLSSLHRLKRRTNVATTPCPHKRVGCGKPASGWLGGTVFLRSPVLAEKRGLKKDARRVPRKHARGDGFPFGQPRAERN